MYKQFEMRLASCQVSCQSLANIFNYHWLLCRAQTWRPCSLASDVTSYTLTGLGTRYHLVTKHVLYSLYVWLCLLRVYIKSKLVYICRRLQLTRASGVDRPITFVREGGESLNNTGGSGGTNPPLEIFLEMSV